MNRFLSKSAITFEPIGFIESCFKQKNGCPRQSLIVPKARGRLRLIYGKKDLHEQEKNTIKRQGLNSSHLVDGLQGFSHIWLFWFFHQNKEEARMKAKVQPPRLDGMKIGALACRTPYRPNPLGMSLVRLDDITYDASNSRQTILHLSGIDLIDKTPVIDIKPYIPAYDIISADGKDLPQVAKWMQDIPRKQVSIPHVSFTEESLLQLQHLIASKKLHFYDNLNDVKEVIENVISLDPRSKHQRDNLEDEIFGFCLDIMNVRCKIQGEYALVVEIEDWSAGIFSKEILKSRTESDRIKYQNTIVDPNAVPTR